MVIDIVDGTSMERNLYLTLQIAELGTPMVIAINMMDEVESRGDRIDCEKLAGLLGVPVVPIVARNNKGTDVLMEEAYKVARSGQTPGELDIYDADLYAAIRGNRLTEEQEEMVADLRYTYIAELVKQSVKRKQTAHGETNSDKLDKILTNRVLGLPVFAAIMYLMFACTFSENFLLVPGLPSPGVWLAGIVENLWGALAENVTGLVEGAGASGWIVELITSCLDGIALVISGGQRVYGSCGLCHGPDFPTLWPQWTLLYSHANGLWLFCAGTYGFPNPGERQGQKDYHDAHPFYVLWCKAAHLCYVCGYAVWGKQSDLACIFHLYAGNCGGCHRRSGIK